MPLSIQDCAESITTRLFTVNWMSAGNEKMGLRIAIMSDEIVGEVEIGGYCYNDARKAVEDELREWLNSLDDREAPK